MRRRRTSVTGTIYGSGSTRPEQDVFPIPPNQRSASPFGATLTRQPK